MQKKNTRFGALLSKNIVVPLIYNYWYETVDGGIFQMVKGTNKLLPQKEFAFTGKTKVLEKSKLSSQRKIKDKKANKQTILPGGSKLNLKPSRGCGKRGL